MFRLEAKRKITDELEKGAVARLEGYEGRARVCARRAAGEAVREYLAQRQISAPGVSAYDLLAFLRNFPEVAEPIRQAAGRLLSKVDEAFQLPAEMDLLADAAWIAEKLEGHLENPSQGQ